ncbi:unnamed protein product [Lactuca saligna]|uniref:Uncharacterized protein n=1 Tax=Lactuca saligna TaxID=75948 RepID=A0AA35ZFJ0_LACSI|nr:unnamed protein product [Lactuca saligna]
MCQELPQGTNNDIDIDNDYLNPRKMKAYFSMGAYDAKARSSSTVAGDFSASPLKKKSKIIFDINELVEKWSLPIEGVREIKVESNVVHKQRRLSIHQTCSSSCLC